MRKMSRFGLVRSLSDNFWGQFFKKLQYTTKSMGLFGVIRTIVVHTGIDYVFILQDKCVDVDFFF